VMLVGSPNCGKTLLFNRLTGLKQKVANFPGITIELAHGPMPASLPPSGCPRNPPLFSAGPFRFTG